MAAMFEQQQPQLRKTSNNNGGVAQCFREGGSAPSYKNKDNFRASVLLSHYLRIRTVCESHDITRTKEDESQREKIKEV